MSWLYSQALVEAFSEATSSDGAPSALSNGNHTPQAYCAPDKMTAFSRLSRFGMTYAPLTADLGEELLMSYLAVFRAKTSAQQEKELASPEADQDSGEKWRGSFVKYDPDSCSWRTHQCSLAGDLEPYLETWPQWGLMRGGECWEQQTLAHHISGTESGSSVWIGTPTATMSERSEKFAEGRMSTPAEFVKNWPTPTVCGNYNRKGSSPTSGDGLATAVQKWPTPNSWDGKRGPRSEEHLRTKKAQVTLVTAVAQLKRQSFPTPQASDNRDRGNMSNPSIQRRAEKGKQLNLSMVAHPTSGQLNPMWVEWLMGWPLGWTDLKPSATDKSHCAPQPLGNYLQKE